MTPPEFDASLVWFRRDLRCNDHAALHHALARSRRVYCAFLFDRDILDPLDREDRRVAFIHGSVRELGDALRALGGCLIVRHGHASHEVPLLAAQLGIQAVFANRDYEPAANQRDATVAAALHATGQRWITCKDQVIFETDEVLSAAGLPYSVFTPYKNAWLKRLQADETGALPNHAIEALAGRLSRLEEEAARPLPSLAELGFEPAGPVLAPGMSGAHSTFDDFAQRLGAYRQTRDFPALNGSSCLSVHLRFGTISVRGLVRQALYGMHDASASTSQSAATWLSQLIWRDFYFMILHHHPQVARRAFKPAYDAIQWETGPDADRLFDAWCEGKTGYPLVDAAMMQLNTTGAMHNRLRMVSASFLVKDLGIDWRRGEHYFARRLNDYDLAANNGGWQWTASTGCDAQPWFRIFNPVTQSEKFDPDGHFIRRYLPQLSALPTKHIHAPWRAPASALEQAGVRIGLNYPQPVVDHDLARRRTLERYAVVKAAPAATQPD